jgi:hypothetical protein
MPLQIAMEENALQFINGTAIENVYEFISNPVRANLKLIIHVPALYAVAEHEFNGTAAQIDATTLEVFRWIYIRAFVVLHQLKGQGSGPRGNISLGAEEWQKVNTF